MTNHPLIGCSEYSPKIKAYDAAVKCLKLGLAGFQLSGDFTINFPENISQYEREQTSSFIHENNIRLHYHAPSDIPLASRHEKLRLGGVQRLMEYIDLAVDMGASSFIFHPGRFAFYKVSSQKLVLAKRNVPESYYDNLYNSVYILAEHIDGKLQLLLENTYNFSDRIISVVDRFLEIPYTGLAWDIGHMNHSESYNQISNCGMADFFANRIKSVKLAHIHDSVNNKSHLPLGTGNLNISAYIDIFNSQNIEMIIEVLSDNDLMKSLDYIQTLALKGQP